MHYLLDMMASREGKSELLMNTKKTYVVERRVERQNGSSYNSGYLGNN